MENSKLIESRENQTFKKLIKLKQKKYRRELGLCIAEGEKQVFDLIKTSSTKIKHIFVRESLASKFEKQLQPCCVQVLILADALFNMVTDLETDPGILAVATIPTPRPISYPYLVLDRIADSGNMGTLLRTAAAFGFGTVLCIDCADAYSPKVLRASMGTQFKLNILPTGDLNNIELGTLIAADLEGEKISAVQNALKKTNGKYGLALGNEGQGLSAEVKKLCTHTTTIPMETGIESLNVAVAGGILMHHFKTFLS